MKRWLPAALCGVFAGFVNGLLGTGGGIILVFALNGIFKETENKDVYATTLTVTLALSLVSVMFYGKNMTFGAEELIKYGLSAAVGGVIGAFLLDRLKSKTVKRLFGALLVVAGINMVK